MDSHQPTTEPTSAQPRATRTTRHRATTALGVGSALVAAFVAGTLVGDGGTPTLPPTPAARAFLPAAAAAEAGLETHSCEELLRSFQARALDVVGPWGWHTWGSSRTDVRLVGPTAAFAAEDTAGSADTAGRAVASSETGTNVQEAGVDEPDLAKTDGRRLFRTSNGALLAYDVTGDEPRELSSTPLPGMRDTGHGEVEIVLVGDRVVASSSRDELGPDDTGVAPSTRIAVVDVSDASAPEVLETLDVDAAIDSVRQHDDLVRVVLANQLPALDFRTDADSRFDERAALAHNRRLVRRTTLADWLPQGVVGSPGSDEGALVECDRVAVPDDGSGLGTTSVLTFDPDAVAPGDFATSGVALAARTSTTYVAADRLYLASEVDGFLAPVDAWGPDPLIRSPGRARSDAGRTHLHAFALEGRRTSFVASGTVKGRVADRWSMDSADRVLRVAVGATEATGNFSSVLTLAERDGRLVETGRVDKLGVDEEIKSVRWFDDLAVVVTFRQTDPLYAIDLTDTTAPRLLGELKIPGFSQYLHPVNDTQLIGVGQRANARTGATRGGQAALFDISDLTDPRRLDVVSYPRDSWMNAADDPRQFTWLPEARTALTVVSSGEVGRTGWVTELTVAGGELRERRTEVAYGLDVSRVRLLPLGERRVALVTGDEVRFIDVA